MFAGLLLKFKDASIQWAERIMRRIDRTVEETD
jgi:hypothetical protein